MNRQVFPGWRAGITRSELRLRALRLGVWLPCLRVVGDREMAQIVKMEIGRRLESQLSGHSGHRRKRRAAKEPKE